MINYLEIFKGFGSRLDAIAIYKPIIDLDRKGKLIGIPLSSIGLSILLFMMDNMLQNKKNNTYKDIAHFIQRLLRDEVSYEMDYAEAEEQTILIVRESLRNSGQPFVYEYYDFENHAFKEKTFHIIDFPEESLDLTAASNNRESFILTPEAIEGLFKTREIFQEMQLTIMQLYFRQQIDRGVFDGAEKTVEEMIFLLRNRYSEMKQLLISISRDVLQIAREKEFEKTIRRYENTLEKEKESFSDIKSLVDYTLDKYYRGNGEWSEKEAEAIRSIRRIQQRWNNVMQQHELLFGLKQDIQMSFTENIEELMFNSFHTTINFEREIMPLVIENQINLGGLQTIMKPINPMKPDRLFHPDLFFVPQKKKKEYENIKEPLPELTQEERDFQEKKERERIQTKINNLHEIFSYIFTPLFEKEEYNMAQYIVTIPEQITSQDDFYIVLLQMHQRRFISFEPINPELLPHLDEFGQALSEFITKSGINKVCSSASIKLIPEEIIGLKILGKEFSNLKIRRNHDDQ